MRKKLLLTLMLIALSVCLFTISVCAEDRTQISYTDASGVTHTVDVVKFDDDTPENVGSVLGNNTTHQARFKDDGAYAILKATDGSLCAYPTWYLIEPSGINAEYIAISELEYTYVNKKEAEINGDNAKTYELGAVLYIEFPNGMTHLRDNGVFGRGTHYEKNVTHMVIPDTVHTIQAGAFSKNTTLKSIDFSENNSISYIGDDAFANCSALAYFPFEKLTKLTLIDGFNSCSLLTGELDLSKNESLLEIGTNCFNGCKFTKAILPDSIKYFRKGAFRDNNLTAINLPSSLEYIGDDAFNNNTDMVLSSGILPKNLNYVGVNFLYGCKMLPEVIVFPEGVTSIPDEGFGEVTTPNGKGNLTIVFLGKMTKVIIDGSPYNAWAEHVTLYFANNTLSDFNGNVYSYTDKAAGTLGASVSQTGTLTLDISDRSINSTAAVQENFIQLIFCGNNGKAEQSYILTTNGNSITEDRGLYAFDEHNHQIYYANDDDCTSARICFVCDLNFARSEHTYETEISYSDGFLANGVMSSSCQNGKCLVSQNAISVEPIFVSLGFSVSEFGSSKSIDHGFKINRNAYADYIDSGKTLSYGLIAGVLSSSTDAPLEANNGSVVLKNGVKAIKVEQSFLASLDYFTIKVVGITADFYDISLIIGMYIFDGVSINYVENSRYSENMTGVTYTGISKTEQ